MLIQTRFSRGQKVWFRRGSLLCEGRVYRIDVAVLPEGNKVKYTIQYSESDGVYLDEGAVFSSKEEAECPVTLAEYKELLMRVLDMELYDGRGKGVDVYVCDKCGEKKYTRYGDKGVTPFTMPCKCGGTMVHEDTEPDFMTPFHDEHHRIHKWVRPTYEQFVKLSPGYRDHIMNGALVLEEELV